MDRATVEKALLVAGEIERRENERYPALRYARVHHINTRGQKMAFGTRQYLLSLYKALPRPEDVPLGGIRIVLQKCVQMGASEWAICATLAYAGEHGRAIMYVLPKYDLKYTFTSNRLDKPINRVAYYQDKLRETVRGSKTKGLKDFGRGVIKVVGSNVETEFVEYPADVVIVDEADLCDQNLIPIAADRLKGPGSLRIHIKLGNPTIETGGLHEDFMASTRMEWYVPCPHCGFKQEVRFFGNVMRPPKREADQKASAKSEDWRMWEMIDDSWGYNVGRDIACFCRECGKEMDRLAPGEWWQENPGAQTIGFHLSKLMDPTYRVMDLYTTFRKARKSETDMQTFFNFDLGIPYTSYNAQLSPQMLRACVGSHRSMSAVMDPGVRCVMGADIGTVIHYWIETVKSRKDGVEIPPKVLKVDYCSTFDELRGLMDRYNVACAVIDARPEGRESKRFADHYRRGRVWRCDYEYHGLKDPTKDWSERLMKADRTISMDYSHNEFVDNEVVLPVDFMSLHGGEVVAQMCSSVRVKEKRPNGSEVYIWDPKDKPDHWRHAKNYASLAQRVKTGPTIGVQ